MKFIVDTINHGPTAFYAASNRVEFRKPSVFDIEKDRIASYTSAEAKIDGNRVACIGRLEQRMMHVVTTAGTDIAEKIMQCQWANLLSKRMTDLECFDGELYLPGKGREALSTALAERNPNIRFAVIGNSRTPANASMKELHRIVRERKCDLDIPEWEDIDLEPRGVLLKSKQETPTVDLLLSRVKELGPHYDGIVLKTGMYGQWAKFKHQLTVDLVVLAIKPGKPGKYEGQCGSLICGLSIEDVVYEIAHVSGMDDAERCRISEADVGRVVEVKYERVGTRGRLQHPRIFAWRDDKKPEDCKLDQDPELARYWLAEDEE